MRRTWHRASRRILAISDLHFEHHRDGGCSFAEELDPSGVDVVVIAGDLAPCEQLEDALERICSRFAEVPVVFVAGNHEHYGAPRDRVHAVLERAQRRHSGLTWLDNRVARIAGLRILGTPLWFRRPPDLDRVREGMHDFTAIPGLESWVFDENARALRFLEAELRPGDVVVSHHLPSHACVASRWRASPLNAFFVCELDDLLRTRKPGLWIHGHTHESVDIVVGPTRIVCNPFGYVRLDENAEFDARKIVEVPARP